MLLQSIVWTGSQMPTQSPPPRKLYDGGLYIKPLLPRLADSSRRMVASEELREVDMRARFCFPMRFVCVLAPPRQGPPFSRRSHSLSSTSWRSLSRHAVMREKSETVTMPCYLRARFASRTVVDGARALFSLASSHSSSV
jgi:hypothetical protein